MSPEYIATARPPENKRNSLVILRRTIVVFGLLYLFFLIFYFDFFKKSTGSVASLVDPHALVLVPLGVLVVAAVFALIIAVITYRVRVGIFLRGAVALAALLNISTMVSIGIKSPLAWGSLALTLAALFAVWKVPARRLINPALLCGIVVTGYALINQGLWAWQHWPQPGIATEPAPITTVNTTENKLPSVYLVVMDEFSLSLINKYASFMSLPSLSRLARVGVFYPRAYAIADNTEQSIGAFFTGNYPDHEPAFGGTNTVQSENWLRDNRNLITDLAGSGYKIKVCNDVIGISSTGLVSPMETEEESLTILSAPDLIRFAIRHMARQFTFGLYQAANIGSYLNSQSMRVIHLDHRQEQPQLVYIHLFDAHHDWIRNRDGSFHFDPFVRFNTVAAADIPKITENAFEQYLWADSNTRQLVDSLLAIPEDQRIVIFLSDHGIGWREPPLGRDTGYLNSTQVHVPVIIMAPGMSSGVDTQILPLIDIYPTIVDLINQSAGQTVIASPEGIDGLSLFDGQRNDQVRRLYAYSSNYKYRLEKDKWVLEKSPSRGTVRTEGPIPAYELALTPESEQSALEASLPRPLSPAKTNRPWTAISPEKPVLLLESYRGFAIIGAEEIIYGFPLPDAPLQEPEFYLTHIKSGDYNPLYSAKNVTVIINAIDNNHYIGIFPHSLIPVEEGYRGFNIIANKGMLYAVLRSDGAFGYDRLKNGPYTVLLLGRTLEETRQSIDSFVSSVVQGRDLDELRKIVNNCILQFDQSILSPDYKGFIAIQAASSIYAFPKPDSPLGNIEIHLTRANSNEYFPTYKGKTAQEVFGAIDTNPYIGGEGTSLILVEEGYKGFNIVANKGTLYAVLQADGPFEYERLKNGPYSIVLCWRTLDETRKAIHSYVTQTALSIISSEHKGFIIIQAAGDVYAIPKPNESQSSIENLIGNAEVGEYFPTYKGKTAQEVFGAIDTNPYIGGEGTSLILVEEGYKGFNIIANKGTLYAVLQADGPFEYERLKNGPYTVSLQGRTTEEVKKAIDDYVK